MNWFWKFVGALLLPMNALRHGFLGYTRARDLPTGDIAKAIEYDWAVVARWRKALGNNFDLRGKTILELGPGPDLGVGLIFLALGALRYIAVDRHPLASNTPMKFYNQLIQSIAAKIPNSNPEQLQRIIGAIKQWNNGTIEQSIQYICRDDFSFADVPNHSIDVVVSNAAFEHFNDIADVIKRLTSLAKPNARFVADIDLQTHTRILRTHDPLNIYRFGRGWYTLWKFAGSPNRVRPFEYQTALETNGWKDIVIEPLTIMDEQKTQNVLPFLALKFRCPGQHMHYLDIMITATIPPL